jgi:hypothetical protein
MSLPVNFILKPAVIDGLKVRMPPLANGAPFNVLGAYNVKANQHPAIIVAQGEGGKSHETIGRQWTATAYQDPDTGDSYSISGQYYRQSVSVTIMSTNPKERDSLSIQLREALVALYIDLSNQNDVQMAELTEVGDSQTFEDQAPIDVYMFTFRLAAIAPLLVFTPNQTANAVDVTFELTFP